MTDERDRNEAAIVSFPVPLADAFRLIVPPSPYPTIIEVNRYHPADEPRARRAGGKLRITADGMPQVFRMRRAAPADLARPAAIPGLGLGGVD